jgi:hypothetical protein
MPYRIPPAKVLSQTISEVIKEKRSVISQRRFTELVLANLKKKDEGYSVSEERVRRMAIYKNLTRITIHYRVTEERSDGGKCPVCGSTTKELQNQTLDGEEVKLGFKCVRCPYWTGPNKRVPVRYTFLSLQEGVIEPLPKKRRKKDDLYSQWKFA